ncbi:MAG: transglutaminase domain-containing protein [Candidatus Hodarchaeota archaeon]
MISPSSEVTANLITSLLPANSLLPTVNNPFMYPKAKSTSIPGLLTLITALKSFEIQLKVDALTYDQAGKSENEYGYLLQFPNQQIKDLAYTIVDKTDSNDQKAHKILMWVYENIPYKTDEENYGVPEFWALPTETLQKGCGDCEDQAFLIHSLLLNADVPYDRIKTFGGLVEAGENAPLGGHGWTVYRRETDNEWVVLDACYYFDDTPIADRLSLREDTKYVDDFFYVTAVETRDATFQNYLRGRINIVV